MLGESEDEMRETVKGLWKYVVGVIWEWSGYIMAVDGVGRGGRGGGGFPFV